MIGSEHTETYGFFFRPFTEQVRHFSGFFANGLGKCCDRFFYFPRCTLAQRFPILGLWNFRVLSDFCFSLNLS